MILVILFVTAFILWFELPSMKRIDSSISPLIYTIFWIFQAKTIDLIDRSCEGLETVDLVVAVRCPF